MPTLSVLGAMWLVALLYIGRDAGTHIIHFYIFAIGGAGFAAIWAVRYGVVMRRHPTKRPENAGT